MRQIFKLSAFLIAATFIMTGSALATKPGQDVNPNGFPSGEHYNLNIIGKKADFTCPDQEYYWRDSLGNLVETCEDPNGCTPTNLPIYGNVIFVPENGEGIEIYMQSGKVGGKGKKAEALPQNELWAIDPCAGFDGDGAVIQLPPGEYDVYARALAKPTDNPDMTVSPKLIAVEDESGNDLIWLGLVTDNGFATPDVTFTRNKGKSKAINITGLFEWTGDVCYLTPDGYCDDGTCSEKALCCVDNDGDGIYDECEEKVEELCPEGLVDVTAYCRSYTDKWVFNIADFVTYLWNTDNNGVKLLQVRFYPR